MPAMNVVTVTMVGGHPGGFRADQGDPNDGEEQLIERTIIVVGTPKRHI